MADQCATLGHTSQSAVHSYQKECRDVFQIACLRSDGTKNDSVGRACSPEPVHSLQLFLALSEHFCCSKSEGRHTPKFGSTSLCRRSPAEPRAMEACAEGAHWLDGNVTTAHVRTALGLAFSLLRWEHTRPLRWTGTLPAQRWAWGCRDIKQPLWAARTVGVATSDVGTSWGVATQHFQCSEEVCAPGGIAAPGRMRENFALGPVIPPSDASATGINKKGIRKSPRMSLVSAMNPLDGLRQANPFKPQSSYLQYGTALAYFTGLW